MQNQSKILGSFLLFVIMFSLAWYINETTKTEYIDPIDPLVENSLMDTVEEMNHDEQLGELLLIQETEGVERFGPREYIRIVK